MFKVARLHRQQKGQSYFSVSNQFYLEMGIIECLFSCFGKKAFKVIFLPLYHFIGIAVI